MENTLLEPDKNKVYKFAKFSYENYRGTIMVDFFDVNYNRSYFHLMQDGKGFFMTFDPKRRIDFQIEIDTKKVKEINQILEILKEQGYTVVLTNELFR